MKIKGGGSSSSSSTPLRPTSPLPFERGGGRGSMSRKSTAQYCSHPEIQSLQNSEILPLFHSKRRRSSLGVSNEMYPAYPGGMSVCQCVSVSVELFRHNLAHLPLEAVPRCEARDAICHETKFAFEYDSLFQFLIATKYHQFHGERAHR